MASHGASLKRLASGQGLQYSHACLSAVSVMGGPDGVGRHPIADVSADQAASAPPPLRYNFDNDRYAAGVDQGGRCQMLNGWWRAQEDR